MISVLKYIVWRIRTILWIVPCVVIASGCTNSTPAERAQPQPVENPPLVRYPVVSTENEVSRTFRFYESLDTVSGIVYTGKRQFNDLYKAVLKNYPDRPGRIRNIRTDDDDSFQLWILNSMGFLSPKLGDKVHRIEQHIVTVAIEEFIDPSTDDEEVDCLSGFIPEGFDVQQRIAQNIIYMGLGTRERQESYCSSVRGHEITVGIDMRFREIDSPDDAPFLNPSSEHKEVVAQVIYGIESYLQNRKSECFIYTGALPTVLPGAPVIGNPRVPQDWERCVTVPNA